MTLLPWLIEIVGEEVLHVVSLRRLAVVEIIVLKSAAIRGPFLLHHFEDLDVTTYSILDLKVWLTLIFQCRKSLVLAIASLSIICNYRIPDVLISLSQPRGHQQPWATALEPRGVLDLLPLLWLAFQHGLADHEGLLAGVFKQFFLYIINFYVILNS